MRILIIIIMLFIIGALFIISNNNLALSNPESFSKFSELYIGWLNQIFLNSQKITGEIVKLDWLPGSQYEGEGI